MIKHRVPNSKWNYINTTDDTGEVGTYHSAYSIFLGDQDRFLIKKSLKIPTDNLNS
jgi:hypothetical protein